jgi:ribonuclease P protein component
MFPSRLRLKKEDFDDATGKGVRRSSQNFTAVIPKKANGYAVVVSKKVAKLSVTRHKIKRRVLAALSSLTNLPPSIILYPRASVIDMGYDALQKELTKLLS